MAPLIYVIAAVPILAVAADYAGEGLKMHLCTI